MKYRVAAVFIGAWLLVALVSVLTAGLLVVPNSFTLVGLGIGKPRRNLPETQ